MRKVLSALVVLALAACGGGDSGTNAPPPPPVTTVTIVGADRVKAGDPYQYTAEARTADGTVVVRPVTWSIAESGRGTITQGGLLTAVGGGALTVRAKVENVTFNGAVTAYDWTFLTIPSLVAVTIPADVLISNKIGRSAYP